MSAVANSGDSKATTRIQISNWRLLMGYSLKTVYEMNSWFHYLLNRNSILRKFQQFFNLLLHTAEEYKNQQKIDLLRWYENFELILASKSLSLIEYIHGKTKAKIYRTIVP